MPSRRGSRLFLPTLGHSFPQVSTLTILLLSCNALAAQFKTESLLGSPKIDAARGQDVIEPSRNSGSSIAERLGLAGDANQTRNGIPEGVECEPTTWCDKTGSCSRVCQHGTVKIDPWVAWAIRYQLLMSRQQSLCYGQSLSTHNSAITLADGFGNRDEIYTEYLRWLDVLGGHHELQTNNHWFSLTDQLNMGVRTLELDVHFVADELRIAHCGGFHSRQLNHIISLINYVARKIGRPEMTWDAETLGCSPSLSSIPVKDQRLFNDAVVEVASWLSASGNEQEMLVIILDCQKDLKTWGKLQETMDLISDAFPPGSILTPAEARAIMAGDGSPGSAPLQAPSTAELVTRWGKRVLVLSVEDFGEDMDALMFSTTMAVLCPYAEAWMRDFRLNPSWDQEGKLPQLQQLDAKQEQQQQQDQQREQQQRQLRLAEAWDEFETLSKAQALLPWDEQQEAAVRQELQRLVAEEWAGLGSSSSEAPEGGFRSLHDDGAAEDGVAEAGGAVTTGADATGGSSLGEGYSGSSSSLPLAASVAADAGCKSACCLSVPDSSPHQHRVAHPAEGRIWRMVSCELRYGPLTCEFHLASTNKGSSMNNEELAEVTSCGVNYPATDRLTPAKASAHIWSWAPNHPAAGLPVLESTPGTGGGEGVGDEQLCAYAYRRDGRWRTSPCATPLGASSSSSRGAVGDKERTLAACRLAGWRPDADEDPGGGVAADKGDRLPKPLLWALVELSGLATSFGGRGPLVGEAGSRLRDAPQCPSGYSADIPHTAYENLLLRKALSEAGVDRALLPLLPPLYMPAWISA